MAEAEQTFVESNAQHDFPLPDSDHHELTVKEFEQQNIDGDQHNEYSFPVKVSEEQSLVGHDETFAGNESGNHNEIISEEIRVENEDEETIDEAQPDQGLDGTEVNPEIPGDEANEVGDVPDNSDVDKKELENNSGGAGEEKKWPGWPGESVFRILVPGQKIGKLMGRKGEYIKKLVEETRSRIKVMDGPPGSNDRAVMVSAREQPDVALPPAVVGLLRVHRRIVDGLDDESQGPPIAGAKVSTKLLVPAAQAGNLIGKQGAIVKSIQETSNCVVRVLGQDALPPFALPDDRVVEVVGEPEEAHKAIELISSHLRKFLVDRGIIAVFEKQMQNPQQSSPWGPPQGLPPYGYGPPHQYMPPPPRQHDNYYPPANLPPPDRQLRSDILDYGRDISNPYSAPSMDTQVTQQNMQIPLQYADSVIGAKGSTISYIRRLSGATVTIQETRGVPGEMTVEINGTNAQVTAAQQLVQNFMADAAAAAGMAAPTTPAIQTGGATDQSYSQVYGSYAAPPAPVYQTAPQNAGKPAAQPGAYGAAYGGSYGY